VADTETLALRGRRERRRRRGAERAHGDREGAPSAQSGTAVRQAVDVGSLGQKPLPQRGERRDGVLTVLRRVVAAAEFVEQVGTVGCHQ
jgi:hypothetical protein